MTNFLASKNFSLFCAFLNCVFAFQSFSSGSWVFGLLCSGLAAYCFNNYRSA